MAQLILVSGPAGAGKSTLAKALARHFRFALLDKDCIDEPFSPDDRGDHYTEHIEPKVIQSLLNLAEINLSCGQSVLIDLPWTHILLNSPQWIPAVQTLSQNQAAALIVLECHIPVEALRERLAVRGLTRDRCKLTDTGWEKFYQKDRLGETCPLPHHIIDSTRPPAQCIEDAIAIIDRFLPHSGG